MSDTEVEEDKFRDTPKWKTFSTHASVIACIKRPLHSSMYTRYADLLKNEYADRDLKCMAFQLNHQIDLKCCVCQSLCVHTIRTCRYCEEGIYCNECFLRIEENNPRSFKCATCNRVSHGRNVEFNCPRNYVLEKGVKKYLCIKCRCGQFFSDHTSYRKHRCFMCNIKCRLCNDLIVKNYNTRSMDNEDNYSHLDKPYTEIENDAIKHIYAHECYAKVLLYKRQKKIDELNEQLKFKTE